MAGVAARLAARGDLAPCSCTSTTWGRWPFKPDIVMEASNLASNPTVASPADIDDLQLLTTAHNFATRSPLTTFGDTSAAAALAARFAAMAWAKYPALTPETVRALMVHTAEWTPAMIARFNDANGTVDYKNLLRCFGYGVPNLQRLLSSLDNSLTLVAESELQPFFKDGGRIKTREMRSHPLPWPTDVLTMLGNTDVVMRVTLSYFIEPSPGARGRLLATVINRTGFDLPCAIHSKQFRRSSNASISSSARRDTRHPAFPIQAGSSDG